MKMVLKSATFLQNQFTKKMICNLISQRIFKVSSTNQRLFSNFLPFSKVVSLVKTGDFNTNTL